MENYKKLYVEISANLDKDEYPDIFLMDMYSEKETIMDLLTSLENENYIKLLYKRKNAESYKRVEDGYSHKINGLYKTGKKPATSGAIIKYVVKTINRFLCSVGICVCVHCY